MKLRVQKVAQNPKLPKNIKKVQSEFETYLEALMMTLNV